MAKLILPKLPTTQMYVGGTMTREWQGFFLNLYNRVGEVDALSNTQLESLLGFLAVLSPTRLVASDGTGNPVSVANLGSWISGSAGEITVDNDGDGTVTLSIPDTFIPNRIVGTTGKITVTDDGYGGVVVTISSTFIPSMVLGTIDQITVTDNGDGTVTLSTPQNIDTDADVTFDTATLDALFLALDNAKVYFGASNDASIYYDGTNLVIKSSDVAASDLKIYTGTDKTVELQTPVYEDLNFDPANQGVSAAGWPDYVVVGDVVHSEFTSANNQYVGSGQEIPHSYKLSTILYPHIHIFLKSGESEGTTGVQFTFYWELRSGSGVTTGSVVLSATSAELVAGTNLITIYDSTGFAGPASKGAQIRAKLARTGGDAEDVIVTTYGIHFAIDTVGSRTIASK